MERKGKWEETQGGGDRGSVLSRDRVRGKEGKSVCVCMCERERDHRKKMEFPEMCYKEI